MFEVIEYIFELIVVIIVGRMLSRALQRLAGGAKTPFGIHTRPPQTRGPAAPGGETARDPVCGMFVSTELSQRLLLGGKTFHFCSRECLEKYQSGCARA